MKYIKGDLIVLADSGEYDVIVHGCNCFNTMGAGVAKAVRSRWPEVYAADCNTKRGDVNKLGEVNFTEVTSKTGGKLFVVNAYTQYNYKPANERHLEYGAVNTAFRKISRCIWPDSRILIPRIGAGLARGDWNIIESIIDSFDLDVTCCTLEEQ